MILRTCLRGSGNRVAGRRLRPGARFLRSARRGLARTVEERVLAGNRQIQRGRRVGRLQECHAASAARQRGRQGRRRRRLAAPGKAGEFLGFRIAPMPEEVGSEKIEKYKQALKGAGQPPSEDFAWFAVRSGSVLSPGQITCEHNGTTYLLLWNDKSHVMRRMGRGEWKRSARPLTTWAYPGSC